MTESPPPFDGVERRDPRQADNRRRLEELVALRTTELAAAKEAAEAALAAKSTFLARMSHEIRTPMNTIIGLNHIMLRDVADPHVRAQIGKVLGAAEHLLGLIDDILELSRIEAGQVALSPTDFSPRQLVDGVCGLVSTQAATKGLALQAQVAADVPRLLRGDAQRLRQVLINFATNAIKFTERGSVHVKARVIDWRDGARLRFEVTDTGIGLTEEQRGRVFRAFEQGDVGFARRFGGTGLGLALCLRVAQLMRGAIGVESEPGRGSTFWFEAPFDTSRAASTPADTANAEETGRYPSLGQGPVTRRVLLVDDNEFNLEVAQTLLRLNGYEVEQARDGVEAVEKASAGPYCAILLDVRMPRMDGIEAARRIRAQPRHAVTPIIAMTASVFEEDRRVCAEAGMNDLVAKPVDAAHFARTLQRWAPIAVATAAAASGVTVEANAESAPASVRNAPEARGQLLALQRLVAADDLSAREFYRAMPRTAAGAADAELGRLLEAFEYQRAGELLARLVDGA